MLGLLSHSLAPYCYISPTLFAQYGLAARHGHGDRLLQPQVLDCAQHANSAQECTWWPWHMGRRVNANTPLLLPVTFSDSFEAQTRSFLRSSGVGGSLSSQLHVHVPFTSRSLDPLARSLAYTIVEPVLSLFARLHTPAFALPPLLHFFRLDTTRPWRTGQ